MGSAVPKCFGHGAKTLPCRADFLARVNGAVKNWILVIDFTVEECELKWSKISLEQRKQGVKVLQEGIHNLQCLDWNFKSQIHRIQNYA